MQSEFVKIRKTEHPTSRYRHLYRFKDKNDRFIIETYEKLSIRTHPEDIFYETQSGEDNFLELLAYKFYKNENLWWVIAEANNIINPFEIPVGTILRIPSYNNLRGFKGILV